MLAPRAFVRVEDTTAVARLVAKFAGRYRAVVDKRSKTMRLTRLHKIVMGIAKRFKGSGNVLLAGRSYTPIELAKAFQDEIDALRRITSAQAAHAQALEDHDVVKKKNLPLHRALENYVRASYGDSDSALLEFGLTPRKTGKKTAETKQKAVAKSQATRALRNTMGKNQKRTVRGKA